DGAGLWVTYRVQPGGDGSVGPDDMIITAAFTDDIERHRAELEQVWGGPLCVVRFERTQDQLTRIQNELTDSGPSEFGYRLLFGETDVEHNRVVVGVVFADDEMQRAVDERFGPGTVLLSPALRPVDAASPAPSP